MNPDTILQLLAEAGVVTHEPSRLARVIELALHAARGCRFVPLREFEPTSQKLVLIGRICPVCLREVGLGREGTR